jgi:hypothetical protein
MKQKLLPKFTFALAAGFSLACFLYVNFHAIQPAADIKPELGLEQRRIEEDPADREAVRPNPGVILQVFRLIEKFVPQGN